MGIPNIPGPRGSKGAPGAAGDIGPAGPPNVLTTGTVTKIAAGGTPTFVINGASPTQSVDVGLVTGDTGATGGSGPTGAAGAPAPTGLANVYANAAASNVPRGAVSYALTPGSGGSNGTNISATFSGGNYIGNPVILFDIVSGAVANVRVIDPGLYIGTSPTAPTVTLPGSSGASLTLVNGFLVGNAQNYWVESTDGLSLIPYLNSSGVATPNLLVGTMPNAQPSYSNPGGTGDRTASITVTTSAGLLASGVPSALVNGSFSNSVAFNVVSVTTSVFITFDFGLTAQKIINQARWTQSGSQAGGVWQWRGSQDGVTWISIGATFTLGGVTPPQLQTTLAGNSTPYRYYGLVGVSGTTSGGPFIQEVEFSIIGATLDHVITIPSGGALNQALMQTSSLYGGVGWVSLLLLQSPAQLPASIVEAFYPIDEGAGTSLRDVINGHTADLTTGSGVTWDVTTNGLSVANGWFKLPAMNHGCMIAIISTPEGGSTGYYCCSSSGEAVSAASCATAGVPLLKMLSGWGIHSISRRTDGSGMTEFEGGGWNMFASGFAAIRAGTPIVGAANTGGSGKWQSGKLVGLFVLNVTTPTDTQLRQILNFARPIYRDRGIYLTPFDAPTQAILIVSNGESTDEGTFLNTGAGTGAIAALSYTAAISGNLMTISAVGNGNGCIAVGQTITGTGVVAGSTIVGLGTGTGGTGTYYVSVSQTVSSTTISSPTVSVLSITMSNPLTGTPIVLGGAISGTGVTDGTLITAFGTGTGSSGTYVVSPVQTVSSTSINVGILPLAQRNTYYPNVWINAYNAASQATLGKRMARLSYRTGYADNNAPSTSTKLGWEFGFGNARLERPDGGRPVNFLKVAQGTTNKVPGGDNTSLTSTTYTTGNITASISGNTLTVTALSSGAISAGWTINGAGVTAATISTFGTSGTTGTGDVGTYIISGSTQTVSSEAMTITKTVASSVSRSVDLLPGQGLATTLRARNQHKAEQIARTNGIGYTTVIDTVSDGLNDAFLGDLVITSSAMVQTMFTDEQAWYATEFGISNPQRIIHLPHQPGGVPGGVLGVDPDYPNNGTGVSRLAAVNNFRAGMTSYAALYPASIFTIDDNSFTLNSPFDWTHFNLAGYDNNGRTVETAARTNSLYNVTVIPSA